MSQNLPALDLELCPFQQPSQRCQAPV